MKKSVERFLLIFIIVSLVTSGKLLLAIIKCDGNSIIRIVLMLEKAFILCIYVICTTKVTNKKVYVNDKALVVNSYFNKCDERTFEEVRETPVEEIYKKYSFKIYYYLFIWSCILVYVYKFWAIIIIAMIWNMYTRINKEINEKMM